MRVAIIGNMNNNSNNIVLFLRDHGIDTSLLFFENEAGHFSPEADNVAPVGYPHKFLKWGSYKGLFTVSSKIIKEDLEPFDFLIGSRLAPAYVNKAGRKLDIFIPTGGELHMLPMFSGFAPKDFFKFLVFSRMQRRGIQASRSIVWDATNDELERKIAPVINGMDRIKQAIPLLYYPDYEGENLIKRQEQSDMLSEFESLRADCDILLWHHVKHVWTPSVIRKYGTFHAKGNDQVVRGLAQYYSTNPEKRIKVVMTRYGDDHVATEALAKELDVNRYIHWLPLLPRKELMLGIGVSDAVIGEITRSWFSYGTIIEAMVMGKAVLHNRDDSLYADKHLYPMLKVYDAESVAQALHQIANGDVDLVKMGQQAKRWIEEYGIGAPVREIVSRIEAKSRG